MVVVRFPQNIQA